MAVKISTGARNGILDTGLNSLFDTTGRLLLYTGAQPGTSDTAPTLLATLTLAADAFAAASGGSIAKQGTWTGSAIAGGVVGYARLQLSSDLGTSNTTDKRIDFSVGTSGTDLIIDNATIVNGATQTLTALTITLPTL
jgi:hypothetical protein